MITKAMGALASKALLLASMGPWRQMERANWLGRAARKVMPWRSAGFAARCLANGSSQKKHGSALLAGVGAWAAVDILVGGGALGGAAMALAGGALPLALAAWDGRRPSSKAAAGRLWLSLVSSSELCGSLTPGQDQQPAHWAGAQPRAGRGGRHVGFQELAMRLSRPLEGGSESALSREARRRLLAMALACSGSDSAARWLWRRRSTQQSMKTWGTFLAKGAAAGSEAWELPNSMADLQFFARAGMSIIALGASEASESSIPLLWCGLGEPNSGFQRALLAEAASAMANSQKAPWGWRLIEGEDLVKKKISLAAAKSLGWPIGEVESSEGQCLSLSPHDANHRRIRALVGSRSAEDVWASIAPRS